MTTPISGRVLLCISITLLLSACGNDAHQHPEITSGHDLFEYHCSACHGTNGDGIFLRGVPANRETHLTASQIVHKIQEGDGDGRMPEFDHMPRYEAIKIANYLKSLH